MNTNKSLMEQKAKQIAKGLSHTGLVKNVLVVKSQFTDNWLLKIIWKYPQSLLAN